jgi:hypothetical protein
MNRVGEGGWSLAALARAAAERALASLSLRVERAPTRQVPVDQPVDGMERAQPRLFGGDTFAPPPSGPGQQPPVLPLTAREPPRVAPPRPLAIAGQPLARIHRGLDATSDLEVLSQVLSTAPSAEPTAAASRLFGAERLSWARSAEAVLGARLGKLQGALGTLQGKAEALRQALLDAGGGAGRGELGVLVHVGLKQAAGRLDTVAYRLGVAAELSHLRGDARASLRGVVAAREAVFAAQGEAEGALASLAELSVRGLPRAVGEIRELVRQARAGENELRTSYGQGVVL